MSGAKTSFSSPTAVLAGGRFPDLVVRRRLAAAAASAAIAGLVGGCADMTDTQRRAGTGAAIGTVGGAVLGGATGGGSGARTGAVLGGIAGAVGGYIWSQRMEQQKRAMEESAQGTGIAVSQTPDNQLKLEIPSDISFDVNRSDIKPNFAPVLDRFAQTLATHPETHIRIIGHTDNTGSDQINNPLSLARADSARDYLVARGVQTTRIAIDGRGEYEPLAENATDQGRARNRRVEIFVGEPAQAQAPSQAPPPGQSAPQAVQQMPQRTVPQQAVPQQAVPQQTVPQQTVPQQTVPQQSAPSQPVPKRITPTSPR
jgi:outer membrane protein OmpA-like peptidoglycan-associated protein